MKRERKPFECRLERGQTNDRRAVWCLCIAYEERKKERKENISYFFIVLSLYIYFKYKMSFNLRFVMFFIEMVIVDET